MSFLLRTLRQLPPLLTGFVQSSLPCTPRSSTQINFSSEDLVIGGHSVHLREESGLARDRGPITIDMLPDNVLLEIFNFYANKIDDPSFLYIPSPKNAWHKLVHVSRRWRYLVFASPRRLNLRLDYGGHRPMSEVPDAWPLLPIAIISRTSGYPNPDNRWDNTVAALESEHYNRIREIYSLNMTNSRYERFTAAMQKPFPELTRLRMQVDGDVVTVLPDSFLGGSSPRLRTLHLRSTPFPSMPKLLLSANSLVALNLSDIPDSGYFSPDAMAASLTVMTTLESLHLGFRSPLSRPDPASQPQPPPTRFVLPALTELRFKGVYEYLEDLLARIDAPLLNYLLVAFFMDLNFDVPQLHRLINHAQEFKAEVLILNHQIQLSLDPKTWEVDRRPKLGLQIICRDLCWQLSSLAQVCSPSFTLISALEELEIRESVTPSSSFWKDDVEDTQWVELLDLFTGVKHLYLREETARLVCRALQELSGERATEVLPALHNIFAWRIALQPLQRAMRQFVAARQLSGHPVVIDRWEREYNME